MKGKEDVSHQTARAGASYRESRRTVCHRRKKVGRGAEPVSLDGAVPGAFDRLSRTIRRARGRSPFASLKKKIALTTAQVNGCDYCLAAHSYIGQAQKLSGEEILTARTGHANDSKEDVILSFAKSVAENRGNVTDADWSALRAAGVTDAEAGAVIGEVVLNFLTNLFNNANQTDLDFPSAPALIK